MKTKPTVSRASVRALAVEVLGGWHRGARYVQELLDRCCHRHDLSSADAALLHCIVLAVVRSLTLLDCWIGELTAHRHLDHRARELLRTGLAQILLLDHPPHAAVNETVAAAGRAKSLVNAILRRASRDRTAILSGTKDLPLWIRVSHPEWLVKRWEAAFGKERTAALCDWNQQPAEVFVRVNRLHPDAESFAARMKGYEVGGSGFFRCAQLPREELAAGVCYAQDPSTALAPRLLDPQPGETVLDACAAPGGKTAMLAESMRKLGRLVACDVSPSRLRRLEENLNRLQVTNAEVVRHDLLNSKSPPWGDLQFDKILLDVPCSNTGVMRRRVDVRWRLQEGDVKKLAKAQADLLLRCAEFLKPGGTLVYSTCSIDAEENRGVVDLALKPGSGLVLLEEKFSFPPASGMDGAYAGKLAREQGTG